MFKEIAGIAHDMKDSGPVMMFSMPGKDAPRIHSAASGVAAMLGKDGKAVLPEEIVKQMAANGWAPAKMSDVEAAFVSASSHDDPPKSPEEARAAFALMVMKG